MYDVIVDGYRARKGVSIMRACRFACLQNKHEETGRDGYKPNRQDLTEERHEFKLVS